MSQEKVRFTHTKDERGHRATLPAGMRWRFKECGRRYVVARCVPCELEAARSAGGAKS